MTRFFTATLTTITIVIAVACGTAPVGIDTCRTIENARCRWAPACGVNINVPVRRDDQTNGVDDCIRYYNDACLHGLVASSDPPSTSVQACVDAINAGDCNVVKHPEISPACSWLLPTPIADAAVSDGSPDADAE